MKIIRLYNSDTHFVRLRSGYYFLGLLALSFLFTACPPNDDSAEGVQKSFQEHHYNLVDLEKKIYKNITFKLPKSFSIDYGASYTFKKGGMHRREYTLGIIFSVERFTNTDFESEFMEDYFMENDVLNSFHDAYIDRRSKSLEESASSFKKDFKKNAKFEGVFQTVKGTSYSGSYPLYYSMATLNVNDEYYVFQFIAEKQMMDVVQDDFERLLASVRKK